MPPHARVQTSPILRPAVADLRYSNIGVERCLVPNCGGTMDMATDGMGRVLAWCRACAERVELLKLMRAAKLQVKEIVRETVRDPTDAELAVLIKERFATQLQLEVELGMQLGGVVWKLQRVKIGTRTALYSRAAAHHWHQNRRGTIGQISWFVAALPSSERHARSAREIAEITGRAIGEVKARITLMRASKRWSQYLQRTGKGARGRSMNNVFRYWWGGPREGTMVSAMPSTVAA
jgi:hypothetical protein